MYAVNDIYKINPLQTDSAKILTTQNRNKSYSEVVYTNYFLINRN